MLGSAHNRRPLAISGVVGLRIADRRSVLSMNNALKELVELVPPPAEPVGAPFDWHAVEATLGRSLPADYKAYCDVYGHGSFFAGWVLDPLTPGHPDSFLDLLGQELAAFLTDDEAASFRPFPAPGGLLAFASTETRDTLWWRTDTWAVVHEDDSGVFEEHALSATEALLLTVRGDGPLEWGNVEVADGDEPVDMTARFHPPRRLHGRA